MALWDLFQNNTGRKIHKWVHYFPIYEKHFNKYIAKPLTFIEVGCGRGGSLQMWKKYFGPYARIIGIDIAPRCKAFEEEQISVRIGNQSDVEFLESVIEEFGSPDIILDDGSHIMSDIISSFNFLYPKIDKTGIYMVEDLHTTYWIEYEGGLRKENTFIEKCKSLIDELNAEHSRGQSSVTDFSKTTLSMHFYDSMVVFEKGSYGKKYAPIIGSM
jgi:SAM-dependent methyltransferase